MTMNLNSVGASINGAIQSSNSSAANRVERNGEQSGGPRPQGSRGGNGEILNAVSQTLGQLGLGTISTRAAPPVTSTQAAKSDNDTDSAASSSSQSVGQALRGFMSSLSQATRSSGAPPPQGPPPSAGSVEGRVDAGGPSPKPANGPPPGEKKYDDLVSRLQNLIQSLPSESSPSSPTSSSAPGSTSELQSAFKSLTDALQGSTGSTENSSGNVSAGSADTPDLRTFLETLVQNLQSAGSASRASAGNVINTSA